MMTASGFPVHFSLVRTTDATVEPLTTTEAKLFLRVDSSDDNDLIDALVKAARQKVENDTNLALTTQTWSLSLDVAPTGGAPIVVPIAPLATVTSITQYAADDTSSVVSTDVYRVDTASKPGRIVLQENQSWPSGLRPQTALVVVFTAGHGATSASVPAALVTAVRLLVAHWYANREAVAIGGVNAVNVPLAYDALVAPYKVAS